MRDALLTGVLAFALTVPWGGLVVEELVRRGIGKRIRYDGPDTHKDKAGTATMGGLYILGALGVVSLVLALLGYPRVLVPLLVMLAFGALGAVDDAQGLQDRLGVGWLAGPKFLWQWGVAAIMALVLYWATPQRHLVMPLVHRAVAMGWIVVPLTAVLMVAFSNAANLTDGLDGLAGGASAIAFAAFGVLAGTSGQTWLALFCLGLVGVILAFLWYNVHPARVFMGDTGSQALGAGLAAIAVISGHWLLLPIIGVLFVVEALSVIVQVTYFKYTRRRYGEGKRVLRMAPLHHHFELSGWSETQTTLRFWIVSALAAALGVALGIG